MVLRRRCAGWDDTAAHEYQRGSLVGDSPKMTRFRKRQTNRRERREGRIAALNQRSEASS